MGIADEMQIATDAYLEEILNRRNNALSAKEAKYNEAAKAAAASALQVKDEAEKGAYKDYMNYINPYGTQAEAMAQRGMLHSGITQSNNARAYAAYQNRKASAQSSYANALSSAQNTLLQNQADILSSRYELEADYLGELMKAYNENYWKEKNFDYKLSRDEIEDARYEQEWAYMLAKDALGYSSSGSRSSGRRSSGSSKGSYTHTEQTSSSTGVTPGGSLGLGMKMGADMTFKTLWDKAEKATANGAKAADKSTAKEIIKVGKSSNLSAEQLNKLSKYLAGGKK